MKHIESNKIGILLSEVLVTRHEVNSCFTFLLSSLHSVYFPVNLFAFNSSIFPSSYMLQRCMIINWQVLDGI